MEKPGRKLALYCSVALGEGGKLPSTLSLEEKTINYFDTKQNEEFSFDFDDIYTSRKELDAGYASIVSPLVERTAAGDSCLCLMGGSPSLEASFFAPSTSGSKKKKEASSGGQGFIRRVTAQLLEKCGTDGCITFSWFNVACNGSEQITDVLRAASNPKAPTTDHSLILREISKSRGMTVPGLTQVELSEAAEIEQVMKHVRSVIPIHMPSPGFHSVMQLTYATSRDALHKATGSYNKSITIQDQPGIGRLTFVFLSSLSPQSPLRFGQGAMELQEVNGWVEVLAEVLEAARGDETADGSRGIDTVPMALFNKSRVMCLLRDAIIGKQLASVLLTLDLKNEENLSDAFTWMQLISQIEGTESRSRSSSLVGSPLGTSRMSTGTAIDGDVDVDVDSPPAIPPYDPDDLEEEVEIEAEALVSLTSDLNLQSPSSSQMNMTQKNSTSVPSPGVTTSSTSVPSPGPITRSEVDLVPTRGVIAPSVKNKSAIKFADPVVQGQGSGNSHGSNGSNGSNGSKSSLKGGLSFIPHASRGDGTALTEPSLKQQSPGRERDKQTIHVLMTELDAVKSEKEMLAEALEEQTDNFNRCRSMYDMLVARLRDEAPTLKERDRRQFLSSKQELRDYEVYKEVMETAMVKLQNEIKQLFEENASLVSKNADFKRALMREKASVNKYGEQATTVLKAKQGMESELNETMKKLKKSERECEELRKMAAAAKLAQNTREREIKIEAANAAKELEASNKAMRTVEVNCKVLLAEKTKSEIELKRTKDAHQKSLEMVMSYQEENDALKSVVTELAELGALEDKNVRTPASAVKRA